MAAGNGTSKASPDSSEPEEVPEVDTFFRVRMESPDGEFIRDVTVQAESEEKARYIVEGQDRAIVDFRLDTEQYEQITAQLQALEDAGIERRGTIPHSLMATHEQSEQYKILSVEEA